VHKSGVEFEVVVVGGGLTVNAKGAPFQIDRGIAAVDGDIGRGRRVAGDDHLLDHYCSVLPRERKRKSAVAVKVSNVGAGCEKGGGRNECVHGIVVVVVVWG
jgi:hypothetical protein